MKCTVFAISVYVKYDACCFGNKVNIHSFATNDDVHCLFLTLES